MAVDFDCCADAAVQHGAHRPMEHVLGFTRSHWMPPMGKSLHRMVDEFVETTQNTNKTQLLASNCNTFWSLVVCENFVPQNGPSTKLINATSCVKIRNATIEAEELVVISSYQTFRLGDAALLDNWRCLSKTGGTWINWCAYTLQ